MFYPYFETRRHSLDRRSDTTPVDVEYMAQCHRERSTGGVFRQTNHLVSSNDVVLGWTKMKSEIRDVGQDRTSFVQQSS